MELQVLQKSIKEIEADTVILDCYDENNPLSHSASQFNLLMDGELSDLVYSGDIKGKLNEITVFYPRKKINVNRVILVGLGKKEELNSEGIRSASAIAIKRAREFSSKTVAMVVLGLDKFESDVEIVSQDTVEGALLALYQFNAPKQKTEIKEIDSIIIFDPGSKNIESVKNGLEKARSIASGVYLARDLVNLSPNIATPSFIASVAEEFAKNLGLNIFVGDRLWAEEQKMGAFLAVSKGAGETPRFIVLEFLNGKDDKKPIILIGKGITFDSGGLSLKPSEGMQAMKSDMAGAAAVLGTMKAIAQIKPELNVIGIAPCTENMPDSQAYRPSDVITASNGKTIEIISTDAEGRMILADALVYASRYQPEVVIDLATLTGACVVALGEGIAAGLFSTHDYLTKKLVHSGTVTQERVWPLPLWDDYKKKIQSDVADMKNTGGRTGGVGSSAVFLKEFIDYPWVHLDIAGMSLSEKGGAYSPSGATGFGVRLLVDFIRNWELEEIKAQD